MYKRILLAYDGSAAGQKALLDCNDIAQWSQAELFLVAVMPLHLESIWVEGGIYNQGHVDAEKQQFKSILDEGLQRLAAAGRVAKGEVLVGETINEITKYAKRIDADLIVVGHKHLDGWAARWWRGSISGALIEHAPCSVLVAIIS
jgi:nucleotide-binding universal stress UspA family protein